MDLGSANPSLLTEFSSETDGTRFGTLNLLKDWYRGTSPVRKRPPP